MPRAPSEKIRRHILSKFRLYKNFHRIDAVKYAEKYAKYKKLAHAVASFTALEKKYLSGAAWPTLKANRRNGGFRRFLGVPLSLFTVIAERVRKELFAQDPARWKRQARQKRGSSPEDMAAMALRFFQVQDDDEMKGDFPAPSSTVFARDLAIARQALRKVLPSLPGAQIEYPGLQEATEAYAAAIENNPPCTEPLPRPVVLCLESTLRPVKATKADNKEHLRLHSGSEGYSIKDLFVFDQLGRICDFAVNHLGSTEEWRASAMMMIHHQDVTINPHKLAMVVDPGLSRYCQNGEDGMAPVYRPLKSGAVLEANEPRSAWCEGMRKANAWAHGPLQKAFPAYLKPTRLADKRERGEDIVTMVHLWNARMRYTALKQPKKE
jgi:hypothetical protein